MRMKRILAPTLLVALAAVLLVQLPLAIAERSSAYELFDPIIDIRRILIDRYVDEVEEDDMQRAMIDSMISVLDDPYTEYVPPEKEDEFNKVLRGTYAGIGAEVNVKDGYLTIVTPMDDSPALHAGVLAGDLVLEIKGVSTYEKPINECIELLMGEPGTDVVLRVRHLDGVEEDLTVTRQAIVTRTVRGLYRMGEDWRSCVDESLGIHYLRITQFNASTYPELVDALNALQDEGLNGLVLDLRDNPGGALPAAVEISDLFLREGDIVSVRPRTGDVTTYSAHEANTLPDFPMIVLVSSLSASASEIVSGALQDNDRAKILGVRTYGKGSVQEVRPLRYNGGTLKYTTAHYYLPSGRNINRLPDQDTWGVDPDPGMIVPVPDDEYVDMYRARREYEIIREPNGDAPACASAPWIRDTLLDEQLALAVEAVAARLNGEPWPVFTDDDSGLTAFTQELRRATDVRTRLLEQLAELDARIDELQAGATGSGGAPLLPEDIDFVNGVIVVRDRYGNEIGSFRIEGGDLELALHSLALTPIEDDTEPESAPPSDEP